MANAGQQAGAKLAPPCIAAGWAHSVALKNDGTVVVWGDNSGGQTNTVNGLKEVKHIAARGNHTLATRFSESLNNPINPAKDLLLIYNTNSADSILVKDYYLAHRPLAGTANALAVGGSVSEFIGTNEFHTNIIAATSSWLSANPTKHPQLVIFFLDIPTGLTDGTNSLSLTFRTEYPGLKPLVTHINMNGTNDCKGYIDKLAYIGAICLLVITCFFCIICRADEDFETTQTSNSLIEGSILIHRKIGNDFLCINRRLSSKPEWQGSQLEFVESGNPGNQPFFRHALGLSCISISKLRDSQSDIMAVWSTGTGYVVEILQVSSNKVARLLESPTAMYPEVVYSRRSEMPFIIASFETPGNNSVKKWTSKVFEWKNGAYVARKPSTYNHRFIGID